MTEPPFCISIGAKMGGFMNRHVGWAVAALAFAGAGCSRFPGQQQVIECGSPDAQDVIRSLLTEQIEKATGKSVRNDENGASVLSSKIRATVSQLKLTLADVRTSKKDPNSAKRFCTARLSVSFPTVIIDDAERARQAAGLSSVDTLADESKVDREANTFKSDIDYNVQPTDDGAKVYGQLDDGADTGITLFAEVLASHLLRAQVEAAKLQADRSAAEQAAAQSAALAQSQQGALEEATAENKLSIQAIGAVWQSLPPEGRQRLLPMQRAWIKKKSADCFIQASNTSLDPNEKEVARLKCDTSANQERSGWLQQIRGQLDREEPSDVNATGG